ncbi:MAG: hypothetical protein JSR90_00735 [Proteobacteria bacterium]|nr:hypothetical protein [Pseudomonadota bacterium]
MSAIEATGRAVMVAHERRAEDAYEAMYSARPVAVKDLYEEALQQLRLAIAAATANGFSDDARRLDRRLAHIEAVYESQFRHVGR